MLFWDHCRVTIFLLFQGEKDELLWFLALLKLTFLATLIFVVIFPLLIKYHKHSAIIAPVFYEHTSPLTDFMNSHMFLESFYDALIIFLTKHTLSVYLLKCFFYSSPPNRLPTWFMKNNLDMQMTMH